jgi:hypothetical protein
MVFADAFAQIKSELGAETREKKSAAALGPEEQLANWRSQMTPQERESLRLDSVKGIRVPEPCSERNGQGARHWSPL